MKKLISLLCPTACAVSFLLVYALTGPATGAVSPSPPPHSIITPVTESGGSTYSWQESVRGTNTGNGDKLTSLPIVSWTARGGLPVALTLNHNSESAYSHELGQKWTFSYDIFLTPVGGGPVSVHWGDDKSYTFTQNTDGSYSAPVGIHDTLVANSDGTYTLTRLNQTQYHFNTSLYCDSIRDENGNTITINHNAGGLITSIVDPTSRTITLGYDGSNRIHTISDPLGRVWTITYDSSNQLTQAAFPVVNGTAYSVYYGYNSAHDITSIIDLHGQTSTFGYNTNDSLWWEQDPYSSQTGYVYTSTTTTITDPNNQSMVYTYDSSGRVTQIKDALSDHEDYQYDSTNNRTQITDKRSHAWVYTYDGNGNVLTAQDPNLHTTTLTYNSHNKPLTTTLSGGESNAFTYDSHDNLTEVDQKDSSGTTLATTTYTIGSYGLVTDKYDPNSHHMHYGYDTNGNLTSTTTPLGNETQWGYNGLGVRTSRTDAMTQTTTYTLDNWNRVTGITYPDSSTKSFVYDPNSNLTSFTDGSGTTSRVYDSDDRLTSESKGGSTVVSHTYDATGQLGLLSSTTDANGRVLTYSYTVRDELASVSETAGTTSYAYDANGDETGITHENATTVTKVYDPANLMTSVTYKNSGGSHLYAYSYVYNSDNQCILCGDQDGSNTHYYYDGLLHLIEDWRTGGSAYLINYTVDGAGNRTSQTVGGVTTTFTYDADDELTSTSGGIVNSYSYNANGDQTSKTVGGVTTTLGYDYDDQLTSLTGGTSFAYDAEGRRVSRTAGGVTTAFLYDGSQVLLEKQGSSTTAEYTYGNALVRKDGEYPFFDRMGNERLITNSSQTITAGNIVQDAFGEMVRAPGSSTSAYQYGATSGYRTDGDAGLMLVGARYYDPQVGRFLTRDTMLTELPYVYCDGDPVNAVDPSGHMSIFGKVLLCIAGVIAVPVMIYEVYDGLHSGYEKRQVIDQGRTNGGNNWNSMRPEDPQHSDPGRHPSPQAWINDPSLPMPGEPGYHNGP